MQVGSHTHITFPSEDDFQNLIKPFDSKQLAGFLKEVHQIEVSFDPSLEPQKHLSLNNPQKYHLFFSTLFSDENFNVFYPEFPRMDHHLVIQIKNPSDKFIGFEEDKQLKLHQLINKISEIYAHKLNITGFVTAQYTEPQARHEGKEIVELIPHHPAHGESRNFLDKVDSNRYVLFDHANISPIDYQVSQKSRDEQIAFWKNELQIDQEPLLEKTLNRNFPTQLVDSYFDTCTEYLIQSLIQLFAKTGAKVENFSQHRFSLATDCSETIYKTVNVAKCAFCNPETIEKQQVFEYKEMVILYNFRKMAYPGTSFLILPKRHIEKSYSLTDEEIKAGALLKRALTNALRAKYPDFDVYFYNQQGASVGQTVFHTHEQVVSLENKSAAFLWTMLSLSYNPGNVSAGVSLEEMKFITSEFRELIEGEIAKLEQHEEEIFRNAV